MQAFQFWCGERREARILKSRRHGIVYDIIQERAFGFQCANAATQDTVTLQSNEAGMWFAQCRIRTIILKCGFIAGQAMPNALACSFE